MTIKTKKCAMLSSYDFDASLQDKAKDLELMFERY